MKADPCRVLELRNRGLTNGEIAAAPDAPPRTVIRAAKRVRMTTT